MIMTNQQTDHATTPAALVTDPRAPNLNQAREFFREQRADNYLDRILELSRVSQIVMTNDPFDEDEARVWESQTPIDPRFHAALRADRLLNEWGQAVPQLEAR